MVVWRSTFMGEDAMVGFEVGSICTAGCIETLIGGGMLGESWRKVTIW